MYNNFIWTDERVLKFCFQYQNKSILDYEKLVKQFIEEESKTIYPDGIIEFASENEKWQISYDLHTDAKYQAWCRWHFERDRKISKVKNKQGVVITVGDITNAGKILSLRINDLNILVAAINDSSGLTFDWNIDTLEIAKPKTVNLPKTEDGVDIWNGQEVWQVDKELRYAPHKIYYIVTSNTKDYLTFSTERIANEYIATNKKKYSDKDIEDAIERALEINGAFGKAYRILEEKDFKRELKSK